MSSVAQHKGWRSPAVCKIVGITYRQLDYWDRTNLVSPSVHSARGSGTQRRYSERDIFLLRFIKTMLDNGLSLHQTRRTIEHLRDDPPGPGDWVLIHHSEIRVIHGNLDFSEMPKSGPFWLCFVDPLMELPEDA